MSDETYEQRLERRRQAMFDEFEADSRAKKQAVLDRWWQQRRDEAEEHRRFLRELNPTGLKIW
jgi:hypothetical protein